MRRAQHRIVVEDLQLHTAQRRARFQAGDLADAVATALQAEHALATLAGSVEGERKRRPARLAKRLSGGHGRALGNCDSELVCIDENQEELVLDTQMQMLTADALGDDFVAVRQIGEGVAADRSCRSFEEPPGDHLIVVQQRTSGMTDVGIERVQVCRPTDTELIAVRRRADRILAQRLADPRDVVPNGNSGRGRRTVRPQRRDDPRHRRRPRMRYGERRQEITLLRPQRRRDAVLTDDRRTEHIQLASGGHGFPPTAIFRPTTAERISLCADHSVRRTNCGGLGCCYRSVTDIC